MLTVCTWLWGRYPASHVATLKAMVDRHLAMPHRFVCFTDRLAELPAGVEGIRTPRLQPGDNRCMRRLWHFSPQAREVLGARALHIDLDVVIVDAIDPLVNRDEPLVIWRAESGKRHGWCYNPTVTLWTPGARTDLWDAYVADPIGIQRRADADGWGFDNSDQAVLTFLLQHEAVPHWTADDGIVSYRVVCGKRGEHGQALPPGARIVSFHGPRDPGQPAFQAASPWIQEHWRC